jgi:hypothetical protein
MKLSEEALKRPDTQMHEGIIQKYCKGSKVWAPMCPNQLDLGIDQDETVICDLGQWPIGCRGIMCAECWDKEYAK